MLMDQRVRLLLKMMRENKGTINFSSKDAGRLLGVGEAHLLRIFNRDVGSTFRGYLRAVRMAGAAELVRNTAMPIKTVATELGYTDISNFYRDFRQFHGMTPAQMRVLQMGVGSQDDQHPIFFTSSNSKKLARSPRPYQS
jgi:AraC-like DNA-binding protein